VKEVKYCFLFILAGLCVLSNNLSEAQDQKDSSGLVEVVIQGKKYQSIRAYKQEQIKNILMRVLSSYDLKEFSEDELCTMIKEIRDGQQTSDADPKNDLELTDQGSNGAVRNKRINEENNRDPSVAQMQEMLKSYLDEHESVDPSFVDPDKVKSIILDLQNDDKGR